jgi:hypothetical protein
LPLLDSLLSLSLLEGIMLHDLHADDAHG